MKSQWRLVTAVLALALGACSNGGGDGAATPVVTQTTTTTPLPETPGEFTYELAFNGCSTGKHKLTTKKAYCDALLNDALNNNCAREMRVENYNRHCTGAQPASPGALPAMSSARCVVNGMDLKDRTFLDNINPFNPQRRQSFRDMFWDGKKEQGYDILLSSADSYGKARFIMLPALTGQAALGEIQLRQRKNQDSFSVRSGLGSEIRLLVTNYDVEKEVEAVCISDKSFQRPKVDLHRVRCSTRSAEEIIEWDMKSVVERRIKSSRNKETVIVRLKPATQSSLERIEIEALELDYDKTLKAEGALNEGLEIRYQSRETTKEVAIFCAPASK